MAENKGRKRQAIEEYVNSTCSAFLAPHSEFVSIECKFTGSEGEGYIRVQTAADEVRYFNITEMTAEEICEMVVKVVTDAHIKREVEDKEERKGVATLFRAPQKADIDPHTKETYVFE